MDQLNLSSFLLLVARLSLRLDLSLPIRMLLIQSHIEPYLIRFLITGRADGITAVESETGGLLILGSWQATPTQPLYLATVVAEDESLDLAVLQIEANADGSPLQQSRFPWVSLGNSDDVQLGDPVYILGYPGVGGNVITYTSGVVSGFGFDSSTIVREWINTDALLSGGSSGGAALGSDGKLIGVVTQGTELDCRPGDTNRDGVISIDDVGCIPVGGSIGQLRPSILALNLLEVAGYKACINGLERSDGSIPLRCEIDRIVFTVDLPDPATCLDSPLYPPGTVLETGPQKGILAPKITGMLTLPGADQKYFVPPGTKMRIVGALGEVGPCDAWPVEVVSVPDLPTWIYVIADDGEQREVSRDQIVSTGMVGTVDERVLLPISIDA